MTHLLRAWAAWACTRGRSAHPLLVCGPSVWPCLCMSGLLRVCACVRVCVCACVRVCVRCVPPQEVLLRANANGKGTLGQLTQIIMEHCDKGSLAQAITKKLFLPSSKWGARLALRALLRTAQEVAQGMWHIHQCNVIHGGAPRPSPLPVGRRARLPACWAASCTARPPTQRGTAPRKARIVLSRA